MSKLPILSRCSVLILILAFVGLSCVKENLASADKENEKTQEEQSPYFSGEMMVKFSDEMISMIEDDLERGTVVTKSTQLNRLSEQYGIKKMERLFPYAGKFEPRTRAAGLHRWYIVQFDEQIPVTKASVDFTDLPGIEYAEPALRPVIKDFDDPKLGKQWHYFNDGSLGSNYSAGADINVKPVWDNFTVGADNINGRDVIVAVVDGGVDQNHEDLKDNCIGGYNFVRDINTITPHFHGTHVAGTIGAVNNNGIGVSGIAGGDAKIGQKGVKILSCQIFETGTDGKDIGTSKSYSAIKWAADHGAVIAQNSWGSSFEKREDMLAEKARVEANGVPRYIKDAVDYFMNNAGIDENGVQVGPMKGGVVIFAAGNDGWEWALPGAAYAPIINVGSIGPDFGRAVYSNYGPWVDIAAPGGDTDRGAEIYSTLPENKYGGMQGTSMACPHVSGVAALLVSYFGGPGFTNEMLTKRLLEGGNPDKIPASLQIGPLLDAYGAFTKGSRIAPEPIPEFKVSAKGNMLNFTFKVPADRDDRKAHGVLMLASENADLLKKIDPKNIPAGVVYATVDTGNKKAGEEMTGILEELLFQRQYSTALIAYDNSKNYSAVSPLREVQTGENHPPQIKALFEGQMIVPSHKKLDFKYDISDPDGHQVNVSVEPGSKALVLQQNPVSLEWVVSITGNADLPGLYSAEIKAVDKYGAETVQTISYEILPNHAPVIKKDIEDMIFTMRGEKFQLDMNEYLEDPDGEQLKFSVSISDKSILHINPTADILNATVMDYGFVDVTITAIDSRNEKCVLTFTVLIKDKNNIVEVYPNPVTDYVNVRTGEAAETSIRIVNASGRIFYKDAYEVSAAKPARIDMTSAAPGNYTVKVVIGGKTVEKRIVKL